MARPPTAGRASPPSRHGRCSSRGPHSIAPRRRCSRTTRATGTRCSGSGRTAAPSSSRAFAVRGRRAPRCGHRRGQGRRAGAPAPRELGRRRGVARRARSCGVTVVAETGRAARALRVVRRGAPGRSAWRSSRSARMPGPAVLRALLARGRGLPRVRPRPHRRRRRGRLLRRADTHARRTGDARVPHAAHRCSRRRPYFRDERRHCVWFGAPLPVERRGTAPRRCARA